MSQWLSRRVRVALVLMLAGARPVSAEEIWFVPPDNLPRFGQVAMADYPQLFEPNTKWPLALSRLNVFGLTAYQVLRTPESELRSILNFLASHHITLDVALQGVPAEHCGEGVEGIVKTVKEPLSVALRLKQLQANVSLFSFD